MSIFDSLLGGKQLSDVFSPGVEELLSAVPALVGSYEQGRGKPIGNVLSTLGQFGLTNAANRQAKHQGEADFAGRLENAAASGNLPPDFFKNGQYQAIAGNGPNTGMSAPAADKELTDVQNQWQGQKQRQEALADKQKSWEQEHKKPFFLSPSGTQAYMYGPDGNITRAPQFDKPPGAEAKSDIQLFLTDRPKWNELQAAKAGYSISSADSKVAGRANTLLNFKLDKTPIQMIPELKNTVLIDRDTLRPVPLGSVSAREALTNTQKYAFVDKKTGTETIPNMAAARRQVIQMAEYSARVLPHGEAGLNTWAKTYANRWKMPFKAVSGGVNEAMFGAARTSLALQLQKAFTGSTRPVNLVEFTRLTGDENPGALTAKDIDAVIPTSRDTFEVAQQKLNVLQQLFDDKLSQLNANTGAPGVYFKSVDDAMKAAGSMPEAPEAPEAAAPAEVETPAADGGSDL